MRASGVPVFRWNEFWPSSTPTLKSDYGHKWGLHVFQLACHQDGNAAYDAKTKDTIPAVWYQRKAEIHHNRKPSSVPAAVAKMSARNQRIANSTHAGANRAEPNYKAMYATVVLSHGDSVEASNAGIFALAL